MRAMGLLGMLGLLLAGCGERAPDSHSGSVTQSERGAEALRGAEAPKAHEKPGRDPRVMLQGAGRAPVRITAPRLENGLAILRVEFLQAAEDVHLQIYGTDGLQVDGERVRLEGASVEEGETLEFDVLFKADLSTHANLVLAVSGSFGGQASARIASFTVGKSLPLDRTKALTAPGGAPRIKEMPAVERR